MKLLSVETKGRLKNPSKESKPALPGPGAASTKFTRLIPTTANTMSKAAVAQKVRLLVPAGKAAPAPPVGPVLGQRGVKSMDFCKLFNDRTKQYITGIPIPTSILVEPNRTFTFITKTPPTPWLLKQAAGVEKGSARPRDIIVGKVTLKHIYEIAKIKSQDPAFRGVDLQQVASRVIGTARGIGIDVVP
ncbi:ribosomal protein L11, RNA binding domain-containing protein [Phlyctochytrium arcticum]|nr:ribosomal protein L11, RNA binding domain-containing protein [Phlyctochytrium arcticum]